MLVKIKVTERPQTVTVEYNGKIHKARWRGDETVDDVEGDRFLLKAALTAWDGASEFELEDTELAKRSGGWWSVGDQDGGPE